MSYTNRPFAPLGDPLAERRTQALEGQATALAATATQAERAATAMALAAGSASYAQRRAEFLALLTTTMSARLAVDITGAIELTADLLAAVDDALQEPADAPPANGQ